MRRDWQKMISGFPTRLGYAITHVTQRFVMSTTIVQPTLTSRQRFQAACRCLPTDRPPVWLMRQAGRALPEYRKLKETYTFVQLVQNPELAVEVTLQPVRRFGFDAAILFSDILVIPEALGQTYHFRETGGVVMDFAVTTAADIARLSVEHVVERLSYVDKALRLLRTELGDRTALIGFSGSPWTLATFMMEGGSVPKYSRALALFREDPKTYYLLAEKLTAAVTAYLQMQADTGVDALQLFDSHGGHLLPTEFQEASGRWMRDIIAAIGHGRVDIGTTPLPHSTLQDQSAGVPSSKSVDHRQVAQSQAVARPAGLETRDTAGLETCATGGGAQVRAQRPAAPPVIAFSLGTHNSWDELIATGANVIGVDWQTSLAEARHAVPAHIGLQGNLSPALISDATPADVTRETAAILETMRGRPGHIFNLGHGLTPGAKLENIAALVDTVHTFKS